MPRPELIKAEPRAGRWARREVRRRQWAVFVSGPWKFVGFVAFVTALGAAFSTIYDGWWSGFVVGVSVSLAVAVPAHLVVLSSGTGPQIMGAEAERWTSKVISDAIAGRARAFDHLFWRHGDIDHLVLTPSKALAVETKWSGRAWPSALEQDDTVQDAVRYLARRARSLKHFLRSETIGLPVPVDQVVVLWGGQADPPKTDLIIDGCLVIPGSQLSRFIEDWVGAEPADLDGRFGLACARVETYLEARDDSEAQRNPLPRIVRHGLEGPLVAVGWIVAGAFCGGVLLLGLGVRLGLIGIPMGVGLCVAIGVQMLRVQHPLGLGVLGGTGLVAGAVAGQALWATVA